MNTTTPFFRFATAAFAAIGLCLAPAAFANDPPVARADGHYATHNNPVHGVLYLNQILANDTDDNGIVNLSGPIEDPIDETTVSANG